MNIYPRLSDGPALELYAQLKEGLLLAPGSTSHLRQTWNGIGDRVGEAHLAEVAGGLRGCIADLGESTRARRTLFDQRMAGWLHDTMAIVPSDAGSPGVWAFMSLVLVPDVAVWRYPSLAQERFLGDKRNCFRRLWMRAELLGSGGGDPPAKLGEDQLVQIMERPSLGEDSRIALPLAKRVIERVDNGAPPQDLMRGAARRLTRYAPFVMLSALGDDDMESLIDSVVAEAEQALADEKSKPKKS